MKKTNEVMTNIIKNELIKFSSLISYRNISISGKAVGWYPEGETIHKYLAKKYHCRGLRDVTKKTHVLLVLIRKDTTDGVRIKRAKALGIPILYLDPITFRLKI